MKKLPNVKKSNSRPDVRIRPLTSLKDLEACVFIQRRVWGHPDLDLIPAHFFQIAVHTGAIVLGAFVDGRLAGYVYSFPADFGKVRGHHSHHLAVLPEIQGLGLGKALKWAQRDEAMKRGLELITWTYDPMQARNANLNLHVLGVVGRRYLRNFYGETPTLVLEEGVPSDRFLVEWWIKSARVKARAKGPSPLAEAGKIPKALERDSRGLEPAIGPDRPNLRLTPPRVLVEVPKKIKDLPIGTGLIASWQTAARRAFEAYFKRGYRLDDFISGDRCYYVLKRAARR
jgi:predicted GNAT superfamily acetyltransferase